MSAGPGAADPDAALPLTSPAARPLPRPRRTASIIPKTTGFGTTAPNVVFCPSATGRALMYDHTLSIDGVQVPRFLYGTAWKEQETQRLTGLALRQGFRGIDTANQRRHYDEAAARSCCCRILGRGRPADPGGAFPADQVHIPGWAGSWWTPSSRVRSRSTGGLAIPIASGWTST